MALERPATPVNEQAVPLAVVYQGWDGYQHELIKIVAQLTPEQLALPVAPHHWSLGQAVQHIVTDRAWWFHVWVGEGGPEILSLTNWDGKGQPVRSLAELVAGLEASWALIESALARYTVADLGRVYDPPASLSEREREIFGPITLQEIIWHVHNHEHHHGGELAVGLGEHQLPNFSGWW